MLLNNGEKYSRCLCCKACADCSELKEVVNFKSAGILNKKQIQLNRIIEPLTTTSSDDKLILQHTKDQNITMFGRVSAQELKSIDCPRCKYIIDHAEKRVRAGRVDKNAVIGVCDHCLKKSKQPISCDDYEDIVKKTIASQSVKTVNSEEKRRKWLAKVNYLYKNEAKIDAPMQSRAYTPKQPSKIQETSYRDNALHKGGDLTDKMRSKPINVIEDDVNISKSEPNLRTIYRTNSYDSYLQRFENNKNLTGATKLGKLYWSKPDRIMSPLHHDYRPYSSDKKHVHKRDYQIMSDAQYFDTYHLPDKKNISKPDRPSLHETRDYDPLYSSNKNNINIDYVRKLLDTQFNDSYDKNKNYMPKPRSREVDNVNEYTSYDRRHKKEFVIPFDENKSLQQIYQRHPLDAKKPINIGEDIDKKRHPSKSVRLTLGDTSVLEGSIYRTRSETSILDLEKSFIPQSITKMYNERKQKIDVMKSHDYIEHYISSTLPRQKNGQEYSSLNKKYTSEEALSTQSELILKKDFSYQFPKEYLEKKEVKGRRTSAELIQETQDMLNAREGERKQRIEIERTKEILEQEIKKKAREEKKRLQEEKSTEEQKRKSEEENKNIDKEKPRTEEGRKKEEKTLKANDEKKKKGDRLKTKEKTKIELIEEDKRKEQKESREKAKSETVDKKNDKADKEAEKIKKQKEKEIQLRMQKEEKQREKDVKDRLKKEKEEQLRAEKARINREKKEEQQTKKTPQKKDKCDDVKSSAPESKQLKIKTPADQEPENEVNANDLNKIRDEFDNRVEASKRKKEAQLEKGIEDEADKKEKENEKQGKMREKEAKAEVMPEAVKGMIKVVGEKNETVTVKELDIKQIKVRKPSYDDLILRLVRLKQSDPKDRLKLRSIPVLDVLEVAREHKSHKYTKTSKCLMCVDSEFELDVESILMKTEQPDETIKGIIIGQKIFKYKPPLVDRRDKTIIMPTLFQSSLQAESSIEIKKEPEIIVKEDFGLKSFISAPATSQKLTEQEAPKGIIRYALSDRTFIEKGWTMLPMEKVVRKMNVYRMRPAHPEFDWFKHNKNKKLMLYDTGEKLADFDDRGRSRLYYRNGRLALDYYNAEEINAQQRFVVFSSGELDERGRTHPITILATFDYLGNGVVFDHGGKIRLKYNQTEGVVLDRGIGPMSHWKWHTLNDPPVLQKVMIDTQMAHKDPDIYKMGVSSDDKSRPDNEEMLAIEFDNFVKEKSKKLTQTFKPFQIKMKALKINDNFSLKILDQATIYLIFRDGSTNVKLNLGMILDHKEIVDTDTADVGEVSNNLERFPARSESLAGLQRSVAYAQRFERARIERERHLQPLEPCTSADQLTAAAARPLRPPLRTARSSSTADDSSCICSRKPCSNNVYYDTRLI